jgi:transaldolase
VTTPLEQLRVKIFGDGADLPGIVSLAAQPHIRGFTTNPTLMRKAGVRDYAAFARQVLDVVSDRPISFEVFSDDFDEMERQARLIASWADNVYVKIPVTNTRRIQSTAVVRRLSQEGIKLNVTALLTLDQVREVAAALRGGAPACVSVFAGRIADTGRDPLPMMRCALEILQQAPHAELIWASPRELLNIVQAAEIGCHIITVTHDLLAKADLIGRDLDDYSLATVRMFYEDGRQAGFQL